MKRKGIMLLLALCMQTIAYAQQFDAGIGAVVNFPFLYNKELTGYNHAQTGLGAMATFRYLPANSNFYPALTLSVGSSAIPVTRINNLVVKMSFVQTELTLSARIIKRLGYDEKRELHYGLGIGVLHFNSQGVALSDGKGYTGPYYDTDSNSINTLMPIAKVNLEYVFPISSEKPLFAGIGGQIGYVYLFDNAERADVSVTDERLGSLSAPIAFKGHMISPFLNISVYYRFGQKNYH